MYDEDGLQTDCSLLVMGIGPNASRELKETDFEKVTTKRTVEGVHGPTAPRIRDGGQAHGAAKENRTCGSVRGRSRRGGMHSVRKSASRKRRA
jgi:hypothetical protein